VGWEEHGGAEQFALTIFRKLKKEENRNGQDKI
jgi:hypothetical protein